MTTLTYWMLCQKTRPKKTKQVISNNPRSPWFLACNKEFKVSELPPQDKISDSTEKEKILKHSVMPSIMVRKLNTYFRQNFNLSPRASEKDYYGLRPRGKGISRESSVCTSPQSPPSVSKLRSWNFAYRLLILRPTNIQRTFWKFVLRVEISRFSKLGHPRGTSAHPSTGPCWCHIREVFMKNFSSLA